MQFKGNWVLRIFAFELLFGTQYLFKTPNVEQLKMLRKTVAKKKKILKLKQVQVQVHLFTLIQLQYNNNKEKKKKLKNRANYTSN